MLKVPSCRFFRENDCVFVCIEVSCSKLARNIQESTTEKLLTAGSSSLEDGTSRGKRKLDETSEPTEAVSSEYRVH